jgi:uncharacterized RDD family membrane protein YckC
MNRRLDDLLYSGEVKLATLDKRVFAYLIDEIILSLLVIFVISDSLSGNESAEEVILFVDSLLLQFLVVKFVYQALFVSLYGATAGKIVMGIKVIGADTIVNATLNQALIRASIRILSESLFFLGYIWGIFDPYKQTWHDKVARTIVIDVK